MKYYVLYSDVRITPIDEIVFNALLLLHGVFMTAPTAHAVRICIWLIYGSFMAHLTLISVTLPSSNNHEVIENACFQADH